MTKDEKRGGDVLSRATLEGRGWRGLLAPAAVISILTVIVYHGVLDAPFLFDDVLYIVENQGIKDLSNFTDLSGTRYVVFLTFALNYAISGVDSTFGYHLFNIVVHAGSAVLVFVLASLVTWRSDGARPEQFGLYAAWAAALFFTVHPVHTQAVTYITQRFASLATLFFLLSVVLFALWRRGRDEGRSRTVLYVFSVVSAVLAMKTKEISFTLPFVILLYDVAFFKGVALKERLWYLAPIALTLPVIPLTLFAPELGIGGDGHSVLLRESQLMDIATLSWYSYFLTEFRVIVTYLRLLFLPVGQVLDYAYPVYTSFFTLPVVASFLFLASIFGGALYTLRRTMGRIGSTALIVSFGVLWFFVTLSVESSVMPIEDVIFEHRLYLPSVGVALAVAFALEAAARSAFPARFGRVMVGLILCFVILLGSAAFARNTIWMSEGAMWEDVVRKVPASYRGHLALGLVYLKEGMSDEARGEFLESLRLKPDLAEAHLNLANMALAEGDVEGAVRGFRRVTFISPRYAKAHANLATTYLSLGRLTEAEASFRRALQLDDSLEFVYTGLGKLLFMKRDAAGAERAFRRAVYLSATSAEARGGLASALVVQGRLDEAIGEYEEAVRLDTTFLEARVNLAGAYMEKGWYGKALVVVRSVLAEDERSAGALAIIEEVERRVGGGEKER